MNIICLSITCAIIFIHQLKSNGLQIISAFKQYLQYINMKNIILILALACLVLSDVILQSDPSDLNITSGTRAAKPATPDYAQVKLDQAPSNAWIQTANPIQTPQNELSKTSNPNIPSITIGMRRIVITKQFYADCLAKMTIYAASNAVFYILINSNLVISGTGQMGYSRTFIPVCGLNTFTMIIYYYTGPIGLMYFIVQDTSSCYNCPDGQRWNPFKCSCECRTSCCTGNQIFRPLPYCDCICKCPKKLTCDIKHYWDENSCSCQCRRPIVCPKGWKQSQTTCQCVKCIPINCGIFWIWDPVNCQCIPPFIETEVSNILSGTIAD